MLLPVSQFLILKFRLRHFSSLSLFLFLRKLMQVGNWKILLSISIEALGNEKRVYSFVATPLLSARRCLGSHGRLPVSLLQPSISSSSFKRDVVTRSFSFFLRPTDSIQMMCHGVGGGGVLQRTVMHTCIDRYIEIDWWMAIEENSTATAGSFRAAEQR